MRNQRSKLCALSLTYCSLFAVGCKKETSSNSSPAVVNGTYSISPLDCVSTEAAPVYPDATKRALLLNFDGISAHTLQVTGNTATESLVSEDCQLVIHRNFFSNEGTRMSFRDNRNAEFVPADCQLTIKFEETTFRFGKSSGIFSERNQPNSEEIPFVVDPIDGGYQITSVDRLGVQEIWQQYGCKAIDQIRTKWTSIEDSAE